MAIHSHPFGGVTLTGPDARRFREQITEKQILSVNLSLARKLSRDGFVKIPLDS